MIFVISRSSGNSKKPCDEAEKRMFESWEERTCTKKYFNDHFSNREGLWESKGKNHKTIHGGKWITRQVDDVEKWFIEINTLEELMAFMEKYGDLVLFEESFWCKNPEIEIYDSYRE